MKNLHFETVLDVKHWNEKLFSFKTTRDQGLRFRNGEFIMIGLPSDNRPVMRAYSIASPNYEEHLEFFSIKVVGGQLTSRLQSLEPGNQIIVSKKPTGTLVIDDLKPAKHLYLFATGTGLAPFLSIVQDPHTYERFDKVILCHGVRHKSELCYQDLFVDDLPHHEYLGDEVKEKFIYYPTVTRENFKHQGRLTDLILSNKLTDDIGLPPINANDDRAMICGNPQMLKDMSDILNAKGLKISPKLGIQGDYVIERAFAE